jgi:hypothetical protein
LVLEAADQLRRHSGREWQATDGQTGMEGEVCSQEKDREKL